MNWNRIATRYVRLWGCKWFVMTTPKRISSQCQTEFTWCSFTSREWKDCSLWVWESSKQWVLVETSYVWLKQYCNNVFSNSFHNCAFETILKQRASDILFALNTYLLLLDRTIGSSSIWIVIKGTFILW